MRQIGWSDLPISLWVATKLGLFAAGFPAIGLRILNRAVCSS